MNEEEKKALKVINARTRRLLDELEIEKEDMSDEPRIAYLMQEIRANKTILNLIEKLQKENEDITQQRDYYKARYNELSKIVDSMAKHIYILGDYACLYEECDDNMDRECEDCIKEYFYKKIKETKDNGSTRNI